MIDPTTVMAISGNPTLIVRIAMANLKIFRTSSFSRWRIFRFVSGD